MRPTGGIGVEDEILLLAVPQMETGAAEVGAVGKAAVVWVGLVQVIAAMLAIKSMINAMILAAEPSNVMQT